MKLSKSNHAFSSACALDSRQSDLVQVKLDLLTMAAAAAFIALLAQVRMPLPFTPVPVTGQTFGVLVAGMLLGRRRGGGAVLLYLLGGGLGLPVFSGLGSGLAYLSGATGGYLLAFPVAAWLVGSFSERGWTDRAVVRFGVLVLGSLVILVSGAIWLGAYVGFGSAFSLGVLPFLPGDLFKAVLGTMLIPFLGRACGHLQSDWKC